mmetsp:Transcript_35523/g.60402  ORF Transcript_35523/g.60402 Transcript_35523/m.60402 type:complete len:249 (+) Transcript_35523:1300-2046(+)
MTASKSRWFVGSSSMRRVGSMNRARASEIRILHPPENILVGFVCISPSNPRPNKIRLAFASAELAPIVFNSSNTSCNLLNFLGSSSPSSIAFVNAFSSSNRFQRTLSAFSTASTAGVSSACTSCSTYKKSTRGGNTKSLDAIIFNNVLFPFPLGPTRPYRLPWAMLNTASLNRIFPAALMLKLGMLISREFCHWGSFSFTAVWEHANCAPSTEALAACFSYSAARAAASRALMSFLRSLLLSFLPFLS